MKAAKSDFLTGSKPLLKKLVELLSESYPYVSILGTDTKGKDYRVSKTGVEVKDIMLAERGFVVRIHNGVNYSEYSFNEISENILGQIVTEINTKLNKVDDNISVNSYPIMEEQEIISSFTGEVAIDPEQISSEVILKELTEIKNAALAYSEHIANYTASYRIIHVSKIYISGKKELEQTYLLGEASQFALARRDDKAKYYFRSYSGMKGYEILDELKKDYKEVVDLSIQLLDSKPAVPGEYDVICAPDISGLIAHEAFGHGVEMDMFVKGRAKGAEYIGKQVASKLTTMHDGAAAMKHMSSYLFDDEGTLGTDTVIIQDGILLNGLSDLLSALKLGTVPTGNGKRQSFERKAYARMTNTFFEAGTDKYEDMLASIQYGYQLEGMYSGMEDPKNWGIQCIALLGREIKDGKFTGNFISPVVMTGFVPELLGSISMVSEKVELEGAGYCGKGYKEYVKTANGGPYIKAKVRLG
jgi:TldD protein